MGRKRKTRPPQAPPRQTPWPALCQMLRSAITRTYPGRSGIMDFCKAHRIDHHAVHHWLDNRREPGPRHWKWLAHFLEMGDSVDGMFTMCQEAAASREVERVAVEAWLVLHPMWKKR